MNNNKKNLVVARHMFPLDALVIQVALSVNSLDLLPQRHCHNDVADMSRRRGPLRNPGIEGTVIAKEANHDDAGVVSPELV